MTNPVGSGQVVVRLFFNEGRPGQKGDPGPAGDVPKTRTISAGAGLMGGGDLSADRSLAADFGDASGTVAEGDDARFSGVAVTSKSSSYTLTAADAGSVIRCTSASANTVTVPAATFVAGQIVEVVQYGAGQVTIAAGAGVTIRATVDSPFKIKDQYGTVSILALSASEFLLSGGLA